jgi:hypothetical protein
MAPLGVRLRAVPLSRALPGVEAVLDARVGDKHRLVRRTSDSRGFRRA